MSVHSLAIVQSRVVISALSRRDDCLSPIPAYRGLSMQCLEISGSQFAEAANGAPTAGHSPRTFTNASGRGSQFEFSTVHQKVPASARGFPPREIRGFQSQGLAGLAIGRHRPKRSAIPVAARRRERRAWKVQTSCSVVGAQVLQIVPRQSRAQDFMPDGFCFGPGNRLVV